MGEGGRNLRYSSQFESDRIDERLNSVKQIILALGALALSTGLALAQTSGGTNMGNGTTTNGMNTMKQYPTHKHHHVVRKMHRKIARNRNGAPTCTQEGKVASADAYHC